jgi:hypothetical protein
MAPPVLRRRRSDGLVEIRPRRARDMVANADAVVLLAMMAAFFVFSAVLVAMLVESPILIGIAGGFGLLGVWGAVLARPLAPAPSFDRPPRHAA